MIKRIALEKIEESLKHSSSVALLGPRQCGKTTLAHTILEKQNSIYLDLESPEDQIKLNDPNAFCSQHSEKLIILDEIQHTPQLFKSLRGVIDKNRRQGKKNNQFLFLGSASMDLLRQSSESLAGRINYVEMTGLNDIELPQQNIETRNKLWFRGGFPESYLANTDSLSMEWIEDLIRSYLQRDIPQFGFRIPTDRLRRLWTMLAHCQGESINASKFGSNLDVSDKTVSHYLDILTDLFLVRRLEPWHANVKKRLVKSPRFYIRDSGILHRLLSIKNYNDLISHPVLGKSWEGFVIENISSILPKGIKPYFYRTSAGAEIDMLLSISSQELWAIEIKNSSAPKVKKGFYQACEDIKATHKFIIHRGQENFPMGNNTSAVTLPSFMECLLKKSAEN